MNFKYTYLAGVCALAATSLASCSSDTPEPSPADEKVNMAFHISIDDLTRADGVAANGDPQTLQYAVYGTKSDGTNGLLFSDLTETAPKAVKNDDGSFTLNLSLPKNCTFKIAFWAETDVDNNDNTNTADQAYVFNRENATITVNYDRVQFNTTAADAYYAYTTKETKSASQTAPISLKRPFSQINIGTTTSDDVKNILDNEKAESQFTVWGSFPNVLNLEDGSVSGNEEVIRFKATRMPQNLFYPVEGYSYIGMGYVLSTAPTPIVGSETTQDTATTNALTCTLHFTITAKESSASILFQQVFNDVQLRANTRTNIYGTLLSTSDITKILDAIN